MSNPTVVAQATLNGNSTTPNITLPAGIQSGDKIVLLIHDGGNVTLTDTGLTSAGFALRDGPRQAGSNTAQGWIYDKTASGSESGTNVACSISASLRWVVMAFVVRNGTFDQITYAVAASTLTTTNIRGAYTPVANDCLALFIMGMTSTSGVGSMTTTPPTGYTEVVDFSTTTGSLDVGSYLASKQLTGQAGVSQTADTTSCTTNVNHRATGWGMTFAPVPSPTAAFTSTPVGLDVNVDGTGSTAVSPATISSYDWDWGDSTTHGTGATATHKYATAGTYTVVLTVTDSASLTGTVSHSVTVTTPPTQAAPTTVALSTGMTSNSGTVLNAITDLVSGAPDLTTFVSGADGSVLRGVIGPLTPPTTGNPLIGVIYTDRIVSTTGSITAKLYEANGTTLRSTVTVSIPSQSSTGGTGDASTGSIGTNAAVQIVWPWSDVQNVTDWNQLIYDLTFNVS